MTRLTGAQRAIRLAAVLAAIFVAAGCSSARKTVYLPDGRGGFMTKCEDDGWQKCYRKATKICRPHNYEVLERQRRPKVLFYSCRTS
jgi:hypothetical protein